MLVEIGGYGVGQLIRIIAKGLNVQALIKWQKGGLCGVAFVASVDPLIIIDANAAVVTEFWDNLPSPV